MKKKLRVGSLFSGCGGFDVGFAGGFSHLGVEFDTLPFEISWANDIDKDAAASFLANFGTKHPDVFKLGDIRGIDTAQCPELDVITAGFPCQPFSNAGNRRGVDDSRGTLFEEVERFIVDKNPKAFVMENVKGILSSKVNGRSVPDEIVNRINLVTNDAYQISEARLIKTEDLGLPQRRHRVIIIGIRRDQPNSQFDFEAMYKNEKIEPLMKINTVKFILKNIKKKTPNSQDCWALSPQQSGLVPYIKRSWKDIPYDVLPERFQKIRDNMQKYHSPNFYRRFALDEICGTITASAQPENCGILHPTEDRRYTVREAARIQTFPDDFEFVASTMHGKYKVIGNAVPPVFAWMIANQLAKQLRR